MNEQINVDALIEAYQEIATSTIGHLLDEGHIPDVFPLSTRHKVVALIRTAKLQSVNASQLRQVLLQAQANEVLVIDARHEPDRACWGEQRSIAAIHCGLAGVVVLGAVTDRLALQQLKLPIFAYGISCKTTRAEGESRVEIDTKIEMPTCTVHSGDLLIADADGVFVLSLDVAAHYLAQFQQIEWDEKQKKAEFFQQEDVHKYYFK